MNQLEMWRLNTQFLIGVVACLGVGLVFIFMFWTVLRTWLSAIGQRHSQRRFLDRKRDARGNPLPPTAKGLCDRCGTVSETVYYLPSGERLCEKCFAAQSKS